MAQQQVKPRWARRAAAAALCAALAALGWGAPTAAQAPADDAPRVLVARDGNKAADLKLLPLRPNVSHQLKLVVENTAEKERPLTVRLSALRPKPAKPLAIATADLGKVPPGKDAAVTVTQWKPAVAPAPPVAGQPPAVPGVELPGPDIGLRVEVLAADGKVVQTKDLSVRWLTPSAYVRPLDAEYTSTGPGKNRLQVRLKTEPEFSGPACPVRLDLRPSVIPGLAAEPTQGTFEDVLTEPDQTVTLVAENVKFRGPTPEKGLVYLTVDGYDRAFIFRTYFKGEKRTPDQVEDAALRIVPRDEYALPAAGWPVRLEVDNPPDPDMQLWVGIDRNRNGRVDDNEKTKAPAPGDRRRSVRLLLPSGDGPLVLKTDVQPWTVNVPSRGLLGRFDVEAGAVYSKKAPEGAKPLGDKTTVTFAGTKPDVHFVTADIAKRLRVGKPLAVRATAESPVAPITKAVFFLGRPMADGKVPQDAVSADAALKQDENGLWVASAELPIPPDSKSPTPISVRFTNAVGLGAEETIKIEWVPPPAAGAVAVKPSIEGVVYVGDLPQPKLEVLLLDAAGATRDSTVTGTDGKYVFKDVVPGSYRVSAAKPDGTKGATPVQVREGEKRVGIDVKMTR